MDWMAYLRGIPMGEQRRLAPFHSRGCQTRRPVAHINLCTAAIWLNPGSPSAGPEMRPEYKCQVAPPLPLSKLSIPTTSGMFYAGDISRASLPSSESPLAPPALPSLLPLRAHGLIFVPWLAERG